MLRNYFKIAFRNLWRHRVYSAINVFGLAIGGAACLLIMLFVGYERSFDGLHRKNVYRLDEVQQWEGMVAPQNVALSMPPMGPLLKNDYPSVLNYARVFANEKVPLRYGNQRVYIPKIFWADAGFLQLFDFELRDGDRATALKQPGSAVLTEETARKLFGEANPVGKTLVKYGNDTLSLKVTGVLKNVPPNSHLQFDGLFSMSTVEKPDWLKSWGSNWMVTYLQLADNTDVAALERKFPAFLRKYMDEDGAKGYRLFLQPLREVHAGSVDITHDYHNFRKFDGRHTYVFSVLALLVLVIAGVNFTNLSTARSAGRAKEVGVRKSVGAYRRQIAGQFIGESVLLSLIALVLAIALVAATLPFINALSDRNLRLPLFTQPRLTLAITGVTLLVGVLSGLYPAVFLSAFRPSKVLKGSVSGLGGKATLRNVLVVGQFAAAIFLIIGTTFATRQLRYMQHQNPGFDRQQVLTIPMSRMANQKYEVLKRELLRNPAVTGVTGSTQRLGNNLHQTGVKYQGDGPVRELVSSQVVVDYDYLSFYRIALVAGRTFSRDFPADNGKTYVINEAMARELLKDTPQASVQSLVGQRFGFGFVDTLGTIIGVAKDFNFNSLHHKVETLFLNVRKEWGYSELSVRVGAGQTTAAIRSVEATWNRLVTDLPFEYTFLDEHFAQLYQSDRQVSQVVGILAGLAILISCLGLFGLAAYTAERRTREIGIRKVLGASVGSIVALLSRNFLGLVLVATLLAWPLAWWATDRWLRDFAYRVDLSPWPFVLAGVSALLIALLTVSFQSIKAARTNPVKALRTE
ncbi:MAG: ABC transporter permease [Ferruginibacter sp.]|nr:ABC transporter permease [Cytophagales bacterium]